MALYRAQVVLHTDDNVPANFATNTWYFDVDTLGDLPDVEDALTNVYDTIVQYLSNLVSQNNHEIKWYLMSDPEPRAPVRIITWNLATNPSNNPLPAEAALCLSFQAARVSGQPQSRRRGRVYIGPLSENALGNDGRPAAGFVSNLRNRGVDLLTQSATDGTWLWAVYSTVNGVGYDVQSGWVDNAFDTQRRRGVPYTTRSIFP